MLASVRLVTEQPVALLLAAAAAATAFVMAAFPARGLDIDHLALELCPEGHLATPAAEAQAGMLALQRVQTEAGERVCVPIEQAEALAHRGG